MRKIYKDPGLKTEVRSMRLVCPRWTLRDEQKFKGRCQAHHRLRQWKWQLKQLAAKSFGTLLQILQEAAVCPLQRVGKRRNRRTVRVSRR